MVDLSALPYQRFKGLNTHVQECSFTHAVYCTTCTCILTKYYCIHIGIASQIISCIDFELSELVTVCNEERMAIIASVYKGSY